VSAARLAVRASANGVRSGRAALAPGACVAALLALALLAIAHVPETRKSPLEPAGAWHGVLIASLLGAFVLYVGGLLLLRRANVALVAVVAVAAAIQCAPLASPLLLSRDTYMYWDYGRIAAIHGGNPYRDFPEQWPADPAYRHASSAWARERSPYGPGWTLVGEADAKLAGSSARAATLFFRVLAAAALLVAVAVIAAATRSPFSTALVGWNPVLALHLAGGGHADAAMMALAAVGLALAARRPAAAGVAWVAATAVKVAALAFLGVELVYRLRQRSRRWFAGLVAGGLAAIAAATALYGTQWVRSAGPISNQLRESNAIGLPARLHQLGLPLHAAQMLTAAAFVLLYLWILLQAWRGRRRLSLAAAGLCLAIAWLMPWYATWPLVLGAFDLDAAGIALGVALSGYVMLDALPL
jgi:Glycosyltransferase family 87